MVRHGAVAGLGVRCARRGGVGRGRGKSLGGHAHRGCLWLDHQRAHTHTRLSPSVRARASMRCIRMHATGHGAQHAMRVSKVSSTRRANDAVQRAGAARRGMHSTG